MQSDGQIEAALARLTENEKACLRRCLLPQTAKEMALDLGISAHAVEKRLKMARAKLGLSSSLDAARLLARVEGYGRLGPQTSDLAAAGPIAETPAVATAERWPLSTRRLALILTGVFLMIVIASLLAVALQAPDAPDRTYPPAHPVAFRPASPDEVRAFVASSFAAMDRDHSGFIERGEAPASFGVGQSHPAGQPPKDLHVTWLRGTTAQAMWISKGDTDADGKVSATEFAAWSTPIFAARGVPVNWKPRS